ncbi:divalent cation tolerance protein CutA [Prevotella sp.]|uniref:divalent cation tolerance protein CutA n=1 Tax=Prevotella sp. TaxID=59823 RepID=UPI003AB5D9AF
MYYTTYNDNERIGRCSSQAVAKHIVCCALHIDDREGYYKRYGGIEHDIEHRTYVCTLATKAQSHLQEIVYR